MTARYDPKNVAAVIALLAERWPLAFSVYERKRRPLAVGIYQQIVAAAVDIGPDALKAALIFYTHNRVYLAACREGVGRIDLNGNAGGVVTSAEAEYAAKVLARRQSKAEAKAVAAAAAAVAAAQPKRIGLADLKAAAQRRRKEAASA